MKTTNSICSKSLALAAGCLLAGSVSTAIAQGLSDDFNDGNDAGWTRYDPIGSHPSFPDQGTWTFPDGHYRIQAPISPLPAAVGPGRVGSLRPEIYTDFYVAVDIVDWNESADQAIGLMARLSDVGLGRSDGYAMTYQVPDHDVDITRFTDEATTGGSVTLSGEDSVTLVPGKSYRFAFIGKGSLLIARVYELPDTLNPIMEASGVDATYTSGQCGLLVFDNSNGAGVADATFDNYFATDVEPPRIKMTDLGFGAWELSWPAEASQFVLQSSTGLTGSAANWTDVSSADIIPPSDVIPSYRYNMGASPENGGLLKQFFQLVRRPTAAN